MFEDFFIWILAAPSAIIGAIAQTKVHKTFKKYTGVSAPEGLTGEQLARKLLDSQELKDIRIETTRGFLTDHYDVRTKVLRLSQQVASGSNLAAIAVSAHETGHALQDRDGYFLLKFRNWIVPAVQIIYVIAPPLFAAALLIHARPVAYFAAVLYLAGLVLALITLPVERNASNRARQLLVTQDIIRDRKEIEGVNALLDAAALTYLAQAVTAAFSVATAFAKVLLRR